MTVSTVPAAARGIRDVLRAALPAGTVIGYGPITTNADAGERIDVLFNPLVGSDIAVRNEWAALGSGSKEERYDIVCALAVWSGDTHEAAIETRIDRAYALLTSCDNAIEANYTLGNAVRLAHISSHSTAVEDARVTVTFAVSCEART